MPDTTMREYLRQLRAARVAEYGLKQRLEKIRWEETVLKPELEQAALEIGTTRIIPEITVGEVS